MEIEIDKLYLISNGSIVKVRRKNKKSNTYHCYLLMDKSTRYNNTKYKTVYRTDFKKYLGDINDMPEYFV